MRRGLTDRKAQQTSLLRPRRKYNERRRSLLTVRVHYDKLIGLHASALEAKRMRRGLTNSKASRAEACKPMSLS